MTPEEKAERLAELKARRRQERWSAFLRPFITLTLFLAAISFSMYALKSCQERNPQSPGLRLPIQKMPEPPPPAK